MSIIEVSAKLGIVYLLSIGSYDKLKLYATLLFIVQVGLICIYRLYCSRHFKETVYRFVFDKAIFKEIAGFRDGVYLPVVQRLLIAKAF